MSVGENFQRVTCLYFQRKTVWVIWITQKHIYICAAMLILTTSTYAKFLKNENVSIPLWVGAVDVASGLMNLFASLISKPPWPSSIMGRKFEITPELAQPHSINLTPILPLRFFLSSAWSYPPYVFPIHNNNTPDMHTCTYTPSTHTHRHAKQLTMVAKEAGSSGLLLLLKPSDTIKMLNH